MAIAAPLAWPQGAQEEFRVYSEHPRLLLKPRRLRLLRRERERESLRWQQFRLLMAAGVEMPEPGFALALYSQAAEDPSQCRKAVEWALGPAQDLRQLALVFDWCQAAMSAGQSRSLAAKLQQGIQQAERKPGISAMRDRVLAAIALADHADGVTEKHLRFAIENWWRGEIAPAVRDGRNALPRDEIYPLFEIFHAIRDNLYADLREAAGLFFRELPHLELLSYYPARYPGPENDYRIPAWKESGEPDLKRAILARAAGLSMVAYDPNLRGNQFLQGWLIHDSFLMRGPFGIPYEFLWANPYQPGVSYHHMPLALHDETFGRLFLRTSWEEDASWLGFFDGELQLFENGERKVLKPGNPAAPIYLGDAAVVYTRAPARFTVDKPETNVVFVAGLDPQRNYEIEADDEELRELRTDPGGILALAITPRPALEFRIRPSNPPPASSQ